MESTISYIIIAALIIVSVYVYNLRKNRISTFNLSVQQYPTIILTIKIKKSKGALENIIINVKGRTNCEIKSAQIELISKSRDFNYYSVQDVSEASFPVTLTKGMLTDITIPFTGFKTLLMEGDHPFKTFRFLVTDTTGRNYKSHELRFNKKWVIYRPDSGVYN